MTIEINHSRKRPSEWDDPLSEIPMPYREALLVYAWKVYESVTMQDFEGRHSSEQDVSARMKGLSPILYSAYLPYHLIEDGEIMACVDLLSHKGPHALSQWLDEHHPAQETLLVIGDQNNEKHIHTELNAVFRSDAPRKLIAGPGVFNESILRNFCQGKPITKYHLQTIEESGGKAWEKDPGPQLEELIFRIFKEKKPTRVVAFEPLRLPATLIALETARTLGLEVDNIEAPSVKLDID